MKTFLKNQLIGLTGITLLALFMWSCGGGQDRASKQKLEETKQQTIQNLNKIKGDIDQRIKYVDEEIEEASDELKEKLKEARAELKVQKDLLTKELEHVKGATLDTWNDVVAKASESLSQARKKTNEVSKNVRNWLDDEE